MWAVVMPTSRRAARLAVACVAVFAAVQGALLAHPQAAVADCGNLPATGFDRGTPWAQQQLGLQQVWPVTEGAGVTVAVVDTGVDARQPFLAGAVLPGADVINAGRRTADTDCDGHGTFVAGIIAARQLPGFGFSGVAPQATILPVRQANSTSDGTARSLADGIVTAVRDHAQVINVSIVTAVPALDLVRAVEYALAHNVVVVAAAGNDFAQGNATQYPAGFPGVLAVGAVDASGQRATFSETGENIGVVAPGTNLLGPGAGGQGLVMAAGGTSFAAPFVAGVAALVRAYHPELTAAQVIHRIEATAEHPAGPLPGSALGWGEVNAYAAVTAVLPGERDQRAPVTSVRIAPPAVAEPGPGAATVHAAALGAAAIAAAGLILAAAVVVRRGRRRGWRPGVVRADGTAGSERVATGRAGNGDAPGSVG